MTQKHTPGAMRMVQHPPNPNCTYDPGGRPRLLVGPTDYQYPIAELTGPCARPNAQRITNCWNGCEDIKNPAAVPELVKALEDIVRRGDCYCYEDYGGVENGGRSILPCHHCVAEAALAAVKAAPGPGGEEDDDGS